MKKFWRKGPKAEDTAGDDHTPLPDEDAGISDAQPGEGPGQDPDAPLAVALDETGEPDTSDVSDDAGAPKAGFLARVLRRKPKEDAAPAPGEGAEDATAKPAGKKKGASGGLAALFSKKKKAEDGDGDDDAEMESSGLEVIQTGEPADYEFDGDQVLIIGKKKVVLGMLWDSSQVGVSTKVQAKDVSSEDVTYNLAAVFRDAGQIGFAESAKGIKAGFKAGVTAFGERRMGRSWVAAFRLGENADVWWVVALRNGQVYEDQLFRDEESARFTFLENLEAPDWQRRIAPEDWDISGTEAYAIQDVIQPALGLGLKPADPIKAYLPRVIVAGILVLAGVAGWLYYQDYQKTLAEREAELKRQREQSIRVSPSDYPWFDAPEVVQFFDDCLPGMTESIRGVPGWTQDLVSCRLDLATKDAMVSTGWTNSGGTIPWIVAAFTPGETQVTVNPDGTAAGWSTMVDFGVETVELAEPWDAEVIQSVLSRRIQTMGIDVTLNPVVQRTTPEQMATMKKPVFNYHELKFTTSAALDEYARLFSDVPAMVPVDLVYDLKTGAWNVTARIYHTPIMPL